MKEIIFKTKNGLLFRTYRENIMKMAPESLFVRMTDPDQQMQVRDKGTGFIELQYDSKYYKDIFAYLNGVKDCVLLKYLDSWELDVGEEILRDCGFFLLPVPGDGWRFRHLSKRATSITESRQSYYAKKLAEIIISMAKESMQLKLESLISDEKCPSIMNLSDFEMRFRWEKKLHQESIKQTDYRFTVTCSTPSSNYSWNWTHITRDVTSSEDGYFFDMLKNESILKSVSEKSCDILKESMGLSNVSRVLIFGLNTYIEYRCVA